MRASGLITILIVLSSVMGCGGSSVPPELDQAAGLVEYFVTPSVLSRSTFPVVLPDGTPKQFVSWLFSGMGTAEWPPTRSRAMEDFGEANLPGMPTLPDSVAFIHTMPDTGRGKQIVVSWDDARGVVVVDGYLDPRGEPVLHREYTVPKVMSTNEVARMTARSYLDMSGSYQAF